MSITKLVSSIFFKTANIYLILYFKYCHIFFLILSFKRILTSESPHDKFSNETEHNIEK